MVPHQQGRSNRHGFPNVALQRLPRQRLTPALALEQPPAMSEEEFNGFFELHFKTAVRNQGKFSMFFDYFLCFISKCVLLNVGLLQ